MADEVTLEKRLWRMGEEKPLTVVIKRDDLGSLSGLTANLDVYDSSQTAVLTDASMTVTTYSTYATATYLLTAKAGGHMTTAGSYDAFVHATLGSTKRRWRIPIEVLPVP